MDRLRFHSWWLTVGWGLVLGVVYSSLTPNPVDVSPLVLGDKLAHFGAYLVLMLWFAQLYARRRHRIIAGWLVLLGVVLEVVQGGLGYRTFDLADMLANALGVVAAWWLAATPLGHGLRRGEARWLARGGRLR